MEKMEVKFPVNNEIYDQLGERWYTADDDPVALLRAESKLRNPWVRETILSHFQKSPQNLKILDIGCGGGFLSNHLAQEGFSVTGLDVSKESLAVARQYDGTQTVHYCEGDANQIAFDDHTFDVVCAMDFLEHVSDPASVILEASRVLKPGGLFFFHTFDRNPVSWLVGIKFVEWFVKNTPKDMHLYQFFIRPKELREACKRAGFEVLEMKGVRPVLFSWDVLRALFTGRVPSTFRFEFSPRIWVGYSGFARKKSPV